eukprot:Hpha_TRINITY_DN16222_c1_g4::TRINITY_DN16222_c1_g4_i1::g.11254::m.11254
MQEHNTALCVTPPGDTPLLWFVRVSLDTGQCVRPPAQPAPLPSPPSSPLGVGSLMGGERGEWEGADRYSPPMLSSPLFNALLWSFLSHLACTFFSGLFVSSSQPRPRPSNPFTLSALSLPGDNVCGEHYRGGAKGMVCGLCIARQ